MRTERLAVPGRDPAAEQQRAALALSAGNVYVGFGGLGGDCGDYVGAVASVPEAGGQPAYWEVPTTRQGGIWAPGGPDVLANGSLLLADGTSLAHPGQSFDGSNAVFNLSPSFKVLGDFAPSNWAQLNLSDGDLGSTAPAVLPGGKAFEVGKQGTGYLVDIAHLGGVGRQVAAVDVCLWSRRLGLRRRLGRDGLRPLSERDRRRQDHGRFFACLVEVPGRWAGISGCGRGQVVGGDQGRRGLCPVGGDGQSSGDHETRATGNAFPVAGCCRRHSLCR